jgi:CheY-like chemotaxis protein
MPIKPMPSPQILVIDDQRSHLRLIKKILERYGWQALTADSAEEAELILDLGHPFRAIITDLNMPWLNGVEFCKKTKKTYPHIKIYALSGNPDLFAYDELNTAGFDGIFMKPITIKLIENILISIAANRT